MSKQYENLMAQTERLANLSPKHIFVYVEKLQQEEKSPSTIKTDLAAIRFFHDPIPEPHPAEKRHAGPNTP